jgi:hypothetical protein
VNAAKGHSDVWAIDRCGSNTCVGSHADPLMHYEVWPRSGAEPSSTAPRWARRISSDTKEGDARGGLTRAASQDATIGGRSASSWRQPTESS